MTISVVTCCMNRNDQLAATIGQWLDRDWVHQIVIVDWNSIIPVAHTLAGMPQDRLSIIRAEGEKSWILSYAYNLGVIHATGDTILKIDADCFIDNKVAVDCPADEGTFYAGNWRAGAASGKTKSVNGQCCFTRGAFEAVNGFSELIRGWGYDDEDFYHRMVAKGYRRHDIACDLFSFLDHSDDLRIAHAPANDGGEMQRLLEQQPYVQQVKNIVIAEEMPWGKWYSRARYRRLGADGVITRVERLRDLEIPIPPAVKAQAFLHAGRMLLHAVGLDPVVVEAADYPAVLRLFEQWLAASRQLAAA